MTEKKTVANHSVAKAFALIEAMAQAHGSMRLQDIAAAGDMPASTALRMLNTLSKMGYVSQNAQDSRYRLTLKLTAIGNAIVSQTDLHAIVHPHLVRLSVTCGESSCLAIEQDRAVVYMDVVTGPDTMIKTMQYIGKRAPMHCTGVGKLMLTNLSPEALSDYVSAKGLPPFTPHTLTTLEGLQEELTRIAAQGFALDNEECELGARCIAAPLKNYTGQTVACISVSGPSTRMSMTRLDEIRPMIQGIAQEISVMLGYMV